MAEFQCVNCKLKFQIDDSVPKAGLKCPKCLSHLLVDLSETGGEAGPAQAPFEPPKPRPFPQTQAQSEPIRPWTDFARSSSGSETGRRAPKYVADNSPETRMAIAQARAEIARLRSADQAARRGSGLGFRKIAKIIFLVVFLVILLGVGLFGMKACNTLTEQMKTPVPEMR